MRARKEKTISISTASGCYDSMDQATQDANLVRQFIIRLCAKLGGYAEGTIGVSENEASTGQIMPLKTGRVGRPRKVFEHHDPETAKKVRPHLHIEIFGCPADTIANEVMKFINRRYLDRNHGIMLRGKKSVCWKKDSSEYAENAKVYLLRQSIKLRRFAIR